MPSFRSTFTTTKQTDLPASATRQDVLRQLHDHSVMITLNPIVIHHEQVHGPTSPPPSPNPDDNESAAAASSHDHHEIFASATASPSAKYAITDRISYLPAHLWDGNLTYTAWFADAPDGLRTFVMAPMGVEIRGCWRVCQAWPASASSSSSTTTSNGNSGDQGGFYLEEEAVVSCNSLLRPFIQSTMQKSHETLHRRFLARLMGLGTSSS